MEKSIRRIIGSQRHRMGEHQMFQPLPNELADQISPFLLLHHHGPHAFAPYNQGLPFGPHPHRGFETLTFIYEGAVEHADSQGFKSVIHPGGIQWMTAGRGIVHSENMPADMREHGGDLEIIQLWMNLPKKFKMTPPHYQGFQKEEISSIISEDGLVNTQVISGKLRDAEGKANSLTNLDIFNSLAKAGGAETFNIETLRNAFLYVLDGELWVNGKLAATHQMVEFNPTGELIHVKAQTDTRFILCAGEPIDEPMVAQGPFVMNSTTEIMQAMRDYQMGKMGVM